MDYHSTVPSLLMQNSFGTMCMLINYWINSFAAYGMSTWTIVEDYIEKNVLLSIGDI